MLDLCEFQERAALREYLGGMSRFDAETAAAREQGFERWQIIDAAREANNANGRGFAAGDGHIGTAMGGQRNADPVPGVQPAPEEENRPLPEREPEAGRDRGALSPLRMVSGQEVQR